MYGKQQWRLIEIIQMMLFWGIWVQDIAVIHACALCTMLVDIFMSIITLTMKLVFQIGISTLITLSGHKFMQLSFVFCVTIYSDMIN